MFAIPDRTAAAFIAPDAVVIGDVTLGEGVSIWYKAIVRADLNSMRIGAFTNIQDGAILHGDPDLPLLIEDHVTVGHGAVIHGIEIGRGSLIGINAVILEGVKVGRGCIIGAGAIVTKDVADRTVVAGVPASFRRSLDPSELENLVIHAQKYYELALRHAAHLSS
jgi:carbonic anhydrase/acetyltransferase-like protein (isoleucine patch superfamily)